MATVKQTSSIEVDKSVASLSSDLIVYQFTSQVITCQQNINTILCHILYSLVPGDYFLRSHCSAPPPEQLQWRGNHPM